MKVAVRTLVCGVSMILLLGGCSRPKLVSRPMSPREFGWSLSIRKNYSAWRPPYFSPVAEGQAAQTDPGNGEEAVPAPAPVPRQGPATLPDEVEFVPTTPAP